VLRRVQTESCFVLVVGQARPPGEEKRPGSDENSDSYVPGCVFRAGCWYRGQRAHKATVAVVGVSTELGRSNYDLGAGPDGLRENVPLPTGCGPPGRSEGPRHRLDSDGHRDQGRERDDNDNPCRLGMT
jgi:hypothetical protein